MVDYDNRLALSTGVARPLVELIDNFKSAKALGLTVPPSILARADGVIE